MNKNLYKILIFISISFLIAAEGKFLYLRNLPEVRFAELTEIILKNEINLYSSNINRDSYAIEQKIGIDAIEDPKHARNRKDEIIVNALNTYLSKLTDSLKKTPPFSYDSLTLALKDTPIEKFKNEVIFEKLKLFHLGDDNFLALQFQADFLKYKATCFRMANFFINGEWEYEGNRLYTYKDSNDIFFLFGRVNEHPTDCVFQLDSVFRLNHIRIPNNFSISQIKWFQQIRIDLKVKEPLIWYGHCTYKNIYGDQLVSMSGKWPNN